MKLKTPSAPFSPVYVHGESITIETEGKVLVLPSGNPDILPSHNEYTLNSNRLSLAESPFGGLKGSGSPDYAPGTVNIIEGDGVYLQDVSGKNSSKTLSAGKLKELGLLSVDTVAHSITEEFIVKNTSGSNNPAIVNACTTTANWEGSIGTGHVLSSDGAKITVSGTTDALGRLTVNYLPAAIDLTAYSFLTVEITSSATGTVFILAGNQWSAYSKVDTKSSYPIAANTKTKYVFPFKAPQSTSANANPNTVSGTLNYTALNWFAVGAIGSPNTSITFSIHSFSADVARPTTLEIQVPDYLADTSAQIYTHNGSAYQLCRTCKLDSAYASVSDTDANCTLADGTKISDVYGAGNGRSVFPKGESGQSKNGSLAGSSITYSQNKGTLKRIGLRVDLPPAGTAAPNFSAVRLKIVTYYTDVNGNKVLDLSGNGNHGTIVGGVTKQANSLVFDEVSAPVSIVHNSIQYGQNIIEFQCVAKRSADATGWNMIASFGGPATRKGWYIGWEGNDLKIKINDGIGSKMLVWADPTPTVKKTIRMVLNQTAKTILCYAGDVLVINDNFSALSSIVPNSDEKFRVGSDNVVFDQLKGELFSYSLAYDNVKILDVIPSSQNMGSTTYQLTNTASASTGLQNLAKPWLALYDPAKTEIDFFLFTHRPKDLEFKKDESGTIHELTLYPGNGQLYHGRVTHCNPALDSDSNNIPDCLEASVEGSLTKFLQAYGMVI